MFKILLMSYFFERNIAEVQKEYSNFLTDILSPLLYEGLKSIYDDSKEAHSKLTDNLKKDPNCRRVSLLQVFQTRLKAIPDLNSTIIEEETNRIKSGSRCYDWFDDLVKATVKSKILMLTFSNSKKQKSKPSLDKSHYENIDINGFIHKCYIECSKLFYNDPFLFVDNIRSSDVKKNQLIVIEAIKNCVTNAIMRTIPIQIVLKEFVETDVFEFIEDIPQSRYNNMMNRVENDIYGGGYNRFEEMSEGENADEMHYSQYNNEIEDRLKKMNENIDIVRKQNKEQNSGEHKKDDESNSYSENSSNGSRTNSESEDHQSDNSENKELNKSIERINNEIDHNIINEPVKVGAGNKFTLLDVINEGNEKTAPIQQNNLQNNLQAGTNINVRSEGNEKTALIQQNNLQNNLQAGTNINVRSEGDELKKLQYFAKYLDP